MHIVKQTCGMLKWSLNDFPRVTKLNDFFNDNLNGKEKLKQNVEFLAHYTAEGSETKRKCD
jgi:hypothetical protein